MVRGIKVSFSASSINMHFGLSDIEDEYTALLDNVSREDLNSMLKELIIEGTKWLKDKGEGLLKCFRPTLQPLAKVWYHVIRTRLLPTTHIETVNKERLVLLHCILKNRGSQFRKTD